MEALPGTGKRFAPPTAALIAVYGVTLAVLYRATLAFLWRTWQVEDYTYCMFVPLVLLYLFWEKRAEFAAAPRSSCRAGLPLLAVALLFFWLGEASGDYYMQLLSLWGVVISLSLLHLGLRKIKVHAFAAFFSLAMFPPPALVYEPLTFQIKLASTKLGVDLLRLYGCSAYCEGNVIDLGFGKLQVVDACSGLRYLLPLVILGLLLAYLYQAPLRKKVVLVLSTVPLAVLGNSLRLAVTGILYGYIGSRATEGFLHEFLGWLIFVLSFSVLALEMRLMGGRMRSQGAALLAAGTDALGGSGGRASLRLELLGGMGLLLASAALTFTVTFDKELPPLRPFAQFPEQLAGWNGSRSAMEKRYLDTLNLTDYAIVDYRDGAGRAVNLYVAYKGKKEKGGFLHSPGTCLPGHGWNFRESGEEVITAAAGRDAMPVNRAFMEKGDQREVVYYWFPKQGRVLTSFWQMKLYGIWDALTTRRTDAALVRLITPVYPGEELRGADRRLQEFTRSLMPVLSGFLPGR